MVCVNIVMIVLINYGECQDSYDLIDSLWCVKIVMISLIHFGVCQDRYDLIDSLWCVSRQI